MGDVKGIKYTEFSKGGVSGTQTALQQSFAKAVQDSISAQVSGLESSSIGLDIQDGKTDKAGVSWVHIMATIPVPEGLSLDSTMSQWPGGPDAIGSSLQTSLRGLAGIEAVTGGTAGASRILVYPGVLHLGALRVTYSSQVTVKMKAHQWDQGTDKSVAFGAVVKKSLVANGKVDASLVTVTPGTYTKNADLDVTAVISSDGLNSEESRKAWETIVLQTIHDVKDEWKVDKPTLATAFPGFKVEATLPLTSEYKVDTVDLDMTIWGIDYSLLSADKIPSFVTDLAEQIRLGVYGALTHKPAGGAKTIHVSISNGSSPGSVEVSVSVPETDSTKAAAEVQKLQAKIDTVYTDVQKLLTAANVPGLKYFSSWTADSIKVKPPGVKVSSS